MLVENIRTTVHAHMEYEELEDWGGKWWEVENVRGVFASGDRGNHASNDASFRRADLDPSIPLHTKHIKFRI